MSITEIEHETLITLVGLFGVLLLFADVIFLN